MIDNFLPGTLERRGWGAEQVRAALPALVWCTIAGFGEESRRPGYDVLVQAESGWMSITGEPEGEPMKHGIALADVLAGKDAAIAILAALVERESDGHRTTHPHRARDERRGGARERRAEHPGQRSRARSLGKRAREPGPLPALPRRGPPDDRRRRHRRAVACLRRALDLTELANDPALATNAGRLAQRTRVVESIAKRLGDRAGVALARATRCRWRSVRPRTFGARGARGSHGIGDDGNAAERPGNDPASATAARRTHGARARRRVERIRARSSGLGDA